MKKPWYWIFVILAGSLLVGDALQFYFAGEPARSTPTRNWLVVGEAAVGVVVIAFGLYMQIRASRQEPSAEHEDYTITEVKK